MKLLLLHGAIGSSDQLAEIKHLLTNKYDVISPDLPGHGLNNEPCEFSIEYFAECVLKLPEMQANEPIDIIGYSMGGYIAMYLARHYPQKVNRIVTLATKFEWTPEIAGKETKMLDAGKIAGKVPAFAAELTKRHSGIGWENVLQRTADMMVTMGNKNPLNASDYSQISNQALILVGDRDKMVSIEETLNVYRSLPNAAFGILPFTPHPIEQVDRTMLMFVIEKFLSGKQGK